MIARVISLGLFVSVFVLLSTVIGAQPCQSGPQAGQKLKPYAALISTGPQRGQSHCYVCEAGDCPAIIVFARTMNEQLGKFLAQIDQAVSSHKKEQLKAWATFLSDNEPALEPKLGEWEREYGLANVPLGVFEDAAGPPSYRLNAEADVTIVLVVRQKVIATFAFRSGELTDERIKTVMKAVPEILNRKP